MALTTGAQQILLTSGHQPGERLPGPYWDLVQQYREELADEIWKNRWLKDRLTKLSKLDLEYIYDVLDLIHEKVEADGHAFFIPAEDVWLSDSMGEISSSCRDQARFILVGLDTIHGIKTGSECSLTDRALSAIR